MFVFDLSDTSYHFNNPTTTNITLCLLSIFQVSVVAAATANNVVVVSLVFLLFFFRLSTAYFYKNYSVQITSCYYIFVITHIFKKVLQRSFFFAAMQQQIMKNVRVFENCFEHWQPSTAMRNSTTGRSKKWGPCGGTKPRLPPGGGTQL